MMGEDFFQDTKYSGPEEKMENIFWCILCKQSFGKFTHCLQKDMGPCITHAESVYCSPTRYICSRYFHRIHFLVFHPKVNQTLVLWSLFENLKKLLKSYKLLKSINLSCIFRRVSETSQTSVKVSPCDRFI